MELPCVPCAGLQGAALCVAWSPTQLHEIAAGDSRGHLLLWDTRRAGVLHAFDQLDVAGSAAAPPPAAATSPLVCVFMPAMRQQSGGRPPESQ